MELEPIYVAPGDGEKNDAEEEEEIGFSDLRKHLGGLIKPGIEEWRSRATWGIETAKQKLTEKMSEATDPGAMPTREEKGADDSALREARQVARDLERRLGAMRAESERAAKANAAEIERLKEEARKGEERAAEEADRIRKAAKIAVAEAERDKRTAEEALRRREAEGDEHPTTQQVREAQARAAKAEDVATRSRSDAAKAIRDHQDVLARLRDAERENEQLRGKLRAFKDEKRSSSSPPPMDAFSAETARGGGRRDGKNGHHPAPELVVGAEEDERRRLEDALQDARIADDGRRLAERRFAEVKRQLGVEEARYGRACAERDAALGQVAALQVRTARLRDELQASKSETTEAAAEAGRARAQVATRVDSSKLKHAQECAEAARRQVVSLDRALDASEARLAASCAARDSDVAELQKRLRAANDALVSCREDLDKKRGQKAFYFSGQLKQELKRLERANDVLMKLASKNKDASGEFTADFGRSTAIEDSMQRSEVLRNSSADSVDEFDARVRCEYFATAMLRAAADGNRSSAKSVAPVARELLGCPHIPIAAWLDALAGDPRLAAACRATMELVLDALETSRAHCVHAADAAREDVLLSADAKTAQIVVETAAAHAADSAHRLREASEKYELANQELSRIRETAERDRHAVRVAENHAKAEIKAASDRLEGLQDRLDHALEQNRRDRLTIEAMNSESSESPEAEHARQCVIAILKEAKVNGPTYSRLIPASTQHNFLAAS